MNVWLALDEISEETGGGLAVARASHTAEYLDCREAIAGFEDRPGKTCGLKDIAPDKAKRLEDVAVVPNMRPGDAIIHTRFLFHRADPFKEDAGDAADVGAGRYSVRYMPGTAEAQPCTFENEKIAFGEKIRLADADPTDYPSCVLEKE